MDLRVVPLLSGDPEAVVLASYVRFSGDAEGQLMMLFRPDTVQDLGRILSPKVFAGIPGGGTSALVGSFLAEVANIVGSSVLNAVADGAGLKIVPTPPVMVRDMVGAVLSSALAYAGASEAVYVVHIKFTLLSGGASFEIVLLPKVSADLDKFLGAGVDRWGFGTSSL